jgi:hypothetical protein
LPDARQAAPMSSIRFGVATPEDAQRDVEGGHQLVCHSCRVNIVGGLSDHRRRIDGEATPNQHAAVTAWRRRGPCAVCTAMAPRPNLVAAEINSRRCWCESARSAAKSSTTALFISTTQRCISATKCWDNKAAAPVRGRPVACWSGRRDGTAVPHPTSAAPQLRPSALLTLSTAESPWKRR